MPASVVHAAVAELALDPTLAVTPLGPDGWAEVARGAVRVRVNVLVDADAIVVLAPIQPVPPAATEAWLRRLLELSFLATGDAAFAIDRESDWVYLRAMRRLAGAGAHDVAELVRATLDAAARHSISRVG